MPNGDPTHSMGIRIPLRLMRVLRERAAANGMTPSVYAAHLVITELLRSKP